MHPAARAFVAHILQGTTWGRVVEVGGRNINGSIRDLVHRQIYLSIDLEDGPEVDVVGDCRSWAPPWPADLVVCCEVLEHADDPKGVTAACVSYLTPGGRLVLTCAGPGREPHSGHDGGTPRDGEHYANISPADLTRWVEDDLEQVKVHYNAAAKDVYLTGVRRVG